MGTSSVGWPARKRRTGDSVALASMRAMYSWSNGSSRPAGADRPVKRRKRSCAFKNVERRFGVPSCSAWIDPPGNAALRTRETGFTRQRGSSAMEAALA